MKTKIEKLEKFMAAEGLTLNEVNAYCVARKQREEEARRQKIAEAFPADDVRSKALLYDYAFEGGKFSSDMDAYPNCQGVVGWINPDPNAPEGDRVYIVLLEQKDVSYSNACIETGVDNEYDGRANTKKLLEIGEKRGVEFPAVEFAFSYCKNGVKQGEAFCPANEQLARLCKNSERLNEKLKKIGGMFEGRFLSSSEASDRYAWIVFVNDGSITCSNKTWIRPVCCILAY